MTLEEIHEILLNIEPERGGHLTGDYKTSKLILASHLRSQKQFLENIFDEGDASDATNYRDIILRELNNIESELTKLNQ